MRKSIQILIILIPGCISALGQENALEKSEKLDEILKAGSLYQHVSFSWENDLYYQHDYYFTNGFQIDLFHNKLQKSPFNRILIPYGKGHSGEVYSGLQLRQEIFTPQDLASDTISNGDHPYSSTLTLTQVNMYLMPDRRMRFTSGFRLGVLGPASLGSRTQELAHKVSNPSRPPQGWDYQLRNDLIINYDVQVEKGIINKDMTIFGIRGMSRLGTLHTDLETGFWFRFDARNGYFNQPGPSGNPGLNLVFHLSANVRYVFYDATLQGGVFDNSSPYHLSSDALIRWIGNIEVSVTAELYEHQLEIYTLLASPGFRQAEPHGWVRIAYKFWF